MARVNPKVSDPYRNRMMGYLRRRLGLNEIYVRPQYKYYGKRHKPDPPEQPPRQQDLLAAISRIWSELPACKKKYFYYFNYDKSTLKCYPKIFAGVGLGYDFYQAYSGYIARAARKPGEKYEDTLRRLYNELSCWCIIPADQALNTNCTTGSLFMEYTTKGSCKFTVNETKDNLPAVGQHDYFYGPAIGTTDIMPEIPGKEHFDVDEFKISTAWSVINNYRPSGGLSIGTGFRERLVCWIPVTVTWHGVIPHTMEAWDRENVNIASLSEARDGVTDYNGIRLEFNPPNESYSMCEQNRINVELRYNKRELKYKIISGVGDTTATVTICGNLVGRFNVGGGETVVKEGAITTAFDKREILVTGDMVIPVERTEKGEYRDLRSKKRKEFDKLKIYEATIRPGAPLKSGEKIWANTYIIDFPVKIHFSGFSAIPEVKIEATAPSNGKEAGNYWFGIEGGALSILQWYWPEDWWFFPGEEVIYFKDDPYGKCLRYRGWREGYYNRLVAFIHVTSTPMSPIPPEGGSLNKFIVATDDIKPLE